MSKKINFSESVWKKEDIKFSEFESEIIIPNSQLHKVDKIILKEKKLFDDIPITSGCYWIWTNEPVLHQLHKNKIPKKIYGGEIIYNGVTQDKLRSRIKQHLLSNPNSRRSGISMDLYFGSSTSHRKKVYSNQDQTKTPYITSNGELLKINDYKFLSKVRFTKKEFEFIKQNKMDKYFFRNGINIFEPKHRNYEYRVYYISDLKTLYLEFVEKMWRIKYNLPKLCSYKSGR